jgi:organic hydroperoxide reductase OsmC/OhrA
VDPEEAFVASLSSCHMLWFLSLASKKGFHIAEYEDQAEGIMQKNKEGKLAITEVILRPVVTFFKDRKSNQQIFNDLHHQAHQRCYIAHSVKTNISIDAQLKVT